MSYALGYYSLGTETTCPEGQILNGGQCMNPNLPRARREGESLTSWFVGQRLGPLPLWQWTLGLGAVAVGGGAWWYMRRKKR